MNVIHITDIGKASAATLISLAVLIAITAAQAAALLIPRRPAGATSTGRVGRLDQRLPYRTALKRLGA